MGERRYEEKSHAVYYQKYRVSPQEVLEEVLAFLVKRIKTAKPFNLALDVGCGSGQGTVLLAPHFTHVVGTDISPAMLEFALGSDHPPNVSYRLVSAMGVSSPGTDVIVVVKYFYLLACKPSMK